MKSFDILKCSTYSQERLNKLKGFFRIRKLSLSKREEINEPLGKQGVTNNKTINKKSSINFKFKHTQIYFNFLSTLYPVTN